jgi:hypothetical protein
MRLRFALLILATALLSAVMVPPRVRALCGCTGVVHQTQIYAGSGSSCNSASIVWYNLALNEADWSCVNGACNIEAVITTPCYCDAGVYRESGRLTYKCTFLCPGG